MKDSPRLLVSTYHYVREARPSNGFFPIGLETLKEQIEKLAVTHEFVSLSDVESGRLPPHRPACLLTLDDGLREHHDVFVELRDRGIPCAVFVPTGYMENGRGFSVHKVHTLLDRVTPADLLREVRAVWDEEKDLNEALELSRQRGPDRYRFDAPDIARIKYLLNFTVAHQGTDRLVDKLFERIVDEAVWVRDFYLSREQVRELGAEGCLGAHGHTHCSLGKSGMEVARKELFECRRILGVVSGREIRSISYPFGLQDDVPDWVCDLARKAGFVCGFTMDRHVNVGTVPGMSLGRFDGRELPGGSRSLPFPASNDGFPVHGARLQAC